MESSTPVSGAPGRSQVCVALAVLLGTENGHDRTRLGHAVALPEVRVGVQIQQGLEGPGRSRRAVAQRAEGASLAASAATSARSVRVI